MRYRIVRKIASFAVCALFPLSAIAAATAALAVEGPARSLAVIAAVCSAAAAALSCSLTARLSRLERALDRFPRVEGNDENELVNLAGGAALDGKPGGDVRLDSLGKLCSYINDDVASLKRSATKFDLFSSDILFSSRNLAEQSDKQLLMLSALRGRAQSYFDGLSRMNAELVGLSDAVRGNAVEATELRTRALESRERLSVLLDGIMQAAGDAARGTDTVVAVTEAVENLSRGLRTLTDVAEKEAEEALKIGESLKAIDDIVERTHILATNASIEAARAGARGTGFAVIATEIRSLAAASREVLATVGVVLRSVAKGIDDSEAMVSDVSASAGVLNEAVDQSLSIFRSIGERVVDAERSARSFGNVFSEQSESASRAASAADSAAEKIRGFEEEYRGRSEDYQQIASSVEESARGATESQRSARFLAQLAGYLKVGGSERNRILERYTVDQDAAQGKYGRKARRETLLYNLEIRGGAGESLGYLGDLSSTGLLLLCANDFPVGTMMPIEIVLPLSIEGERTMPFTIRTRRSGKDSEGFRIGCSFENLDVDATSRLNELMRTLTMGAVVQEEAEVLEEL